MEEKLTIRQYRGLKGYSQEEVAKKIGISREHLGRMEKDFEVLRSARTDTILTLASIYEVGLDQIKFF